MIYLAHALAAVAVQAIVGITTGRWWTGGLLMAAYFFGREVAQAEYRWIEMFGGGLRAHMPWWGVLDLRVWTKLDQWIDWLGPLVATTLVSLIASRR